ncbi:MAG TPA: hypothetical protein VEC01_05430 [Noviherbaspirillum sp.]|uniref:hypothetical protein n=1 Tax=Noviherbaspirillum sp. TaxID=1926288 RepID=UPI002D43E6BF|nr:hypothetical protein [Noviherbaspirillum sp.]HYD94748.1 hypothetical protein [Noviherbaspirillum sp.]
MKSWKEQLKGVKRALHEADVLDEKRGGKPAKVDFEPPKSWMTDDRSISKRDRESKEGSRPAPIPSKATGQQTSVHRQVALTAQNPVRQPATPSTASPSSDEPLVSPNRTTTPPAFRPHIEGHALTMPDWSGAGRSLQHPDQQGGRAAPMIVRIGVDFGTAFTKVAIRAGIDLVPVDWSPITGDQSATGRYVIPGFVVRASDGVYCWQRLAESEIQGNLKLPILEMAGCDKCPTATLAYLALIIRYARAFLYRHPEVGRKLMTRSLRWELNVGCPTEPHERPEIVRLFGRVAQTAWRLAAMDDLRESNIKVAWETDKEDGGLEAEPGVVPEFVAQIAGYLGSPQLSEGLHALIDVGAATLDVATFNVVLPNDLDSSPRIPIFFSAVRPFGTHYLSHNRHSRLDLDLLWDDAAPIEPADSFAKRHGKRHSEVDAADSDFMNRVTSCITRVIDGTRTNARGDPRSPAWREGLPIFVTGGGSSCQLYRRVIEGVQIDLKRRLGSSSRFRFVELDPLGANASHFGIDSGGRLSVAIGLTQDAENIARVVPHRDVEPIFQVAKERVDHSEIYGDR